MLVSINARGQRKDLLIEDPVDLLLQENPATNKSTPATTVCELVFKLVPEPLATSRADDQGLPPPTKHQAAYSPRVDIVFGQSRLP